MKGNEMDQIKRVRRKATMKKKKKPNMESVLLNECEKVPIYFMTANYDIFEKLDFNRDITPTHLGRIRESMDDHNEWDDSQPMVVKWVAKKGLFIILQGHHRFQAAMELGLEIRFIISEGKIPVAKLEQLNSNSSWKASGFGESYEREGKNPEYAIVRDFQKETGLALMPCIHILTGNFENKKIKMQEFKDGEFETTPEGMETGKHIDRFAAECTNVKPLTHTLFLQALCDIIWHYDYNVFVINEMIAKFKRNHKKIDKQKSVKSYLWDLERVYNLHKASDDKLSFAGEIASKNNYA